MAAIDWDAPLSGSGGWGFDEWPVPPRGYSSDPLSPYFVDPKISEIVSRHPTITECLRRDWEISQWENAMHRWERSKRLYIAVGGIPPALFVAALALAILGQWRMAAAVALVVPVALVWRALYRQPVVPGFPPPRLVVQPFDTAENAVLLAREQPRPFRAECNCPGCGDLSAHPLADASPIRVVRKCMTCNREWTQK